MARSIAVAQHVNDLQIGGKERVAVALANGLAEAGYASHLICTSGLGPLRAGLRPDVQLWCAERSGAADLAGTRRLARFIDESGIALVHTHNAGPSYLMRAVRRLCESRPLHVVHDHRGTAPGSLKHALLDRIFLRNIDAYIGVGQELRARAARLLGLPDDRCLYVVNGIDLPEVSRAPDPRPTVVQVANLQEPKGHRTAMRAAALLRERVPELRWICVGRTEREPGYTREVHDLIASLGLADCVELAGERDDVPAFLARAHVGVLSSDAEALSLAMLEYMAAELPVAMTDVGQGPAILRASDSGCVVPRGDPVALAKGLAEILGDPERGRAMGARGRAHVGAHFSRRAMVEQVRSFYAELLGS